MNTELVRRWVDALESGEYKQGKGTLVRKTDKGLKFCCLGVAYKVCRPKKKFMTNLNVLSSANEALFKNLGLSEPGPDAYLDIECFLMNANDSRGRSFKWIAKWIRKNMLGEKGIRLR